MTDFPLSETERGNLEYLLNTVIPHVEKMMHVDYTKWIEKRAKNPKAPDAIFDLDLYISKRDCKGCGATVTKKYDCGFQACLAGWYKLMVDTDNRFGKETSRQYANEMFADFDWDELSEHFGLSENQAKALFGSRGAGIENVLYQQACRGEDEDTGHRMAFEQLRDEYHPDHVTNKTALRDRKRYLKTLLAGDSLNIEHEDLD